MNTSYKVLQLHPHKLQFFVDEIGHFFLLLGLLLLAGYDDFPIPSLIPFLLIGSLVVGTFLLYRYFYLLRMTYKITGEQIRSEHGVFSTQRNYIELYRVIDYQETQSFLQLIFGIKTITIYSGDRSNPEFKMIGIKSEFELIESLRERVEYNKIRRHIYEFTNNQ